MQLVPERSQLDRGCVALFGDQPCTNQDKMELEDDKTSSAREEIREESASTVQPFQ